MAVTTEREADRPRVDARTEVIEQVPIGTRRRLAELWQFRGLLRFFAWTFIRKFYANTWLGWVWLPLRPALGLAARALVYGTILKTNTSGIPYLVFFALGAAVWELFAMSWYYGTRSMEITRRYIKRIYVPRLIVLLSAVAPGIMWFCLYLTMFVCAVAYYAIAEGTLYIHIGAETLVALAGLMLAVLLAISLGLWTSVFGGLGVRDPRFIVHQILGVWFYLTPVIYPLRLVPDQLQGAMSLNPMSAPMEMVRLGILGDGQVETRGVLLCVGWILVVGATGIRFFNASESRALDRL
jgi:lipopolysaccharide transport system permease protein